MQKKLVRDERIMLDVLDHHKSVLISAEEFAALFNRVSE